MASMCKLNSPNGYKLKKHICGCLREDDNCYEAKTSKFNQEERTHNILPKATLMSDINGWKETYRQPGEKSNIMNTLKSLLDTAPPKKSIKIMNM